MASNLIYQPALTGQALDQAIDESSQSRPALIEGFVYQKSVTMFSGDGGTGKSTLVANIIAQSSVGLPVFQTLHVPNPILWYYIPFERGKSEIAERLKHIRESVPYNTNNIIIFYHKDGYVPNLCNKADQDFLISSIIKDCKGRNPDIVSYDPIYQAVIGGLASEEKVSIFIRFNTRLMEQFGCSTWFNNNTLKDSYEGRVKVRKEDPYYGHSYLKNHCTGSFLVERAKDHDGTLISCKKDNLDLLLKKIPLHYDPETYTSYMKDSLKGVSKADQVKIALRQYKTLNKTFTFRQVQGCIQGVSTSYLRDLFRTPPYSTALTKDKSNPENTLYTVTGDI